MCLKNSVATLMVVFASNSWADMECASTNDSLFVQMWESASIRESASRCDPVMDGSQRLADLDTTYFGSSQSDEVYRDEVRLISGAVVNPNTLFRVDRGRIERFSVLGNKVESSTIEIDTVDGFFTLE